MIKNEHPPSAVLLLKKPSAASSRKPTTQTTSQPSTHPGQTPLGLLLSENKKLVYMSLRVLEEIQQHQVTTGTDIATKIMQTCSLKLDFKNVQRRVYDALNVLCALGVTVKNKNQV